MLTVSKIYLLKGMKTHIFCHYSSMSALHFLNPNPIPGLYKNERFQTNRLLCIVFWSLNKNILIKNFGLSWFHTHMFRENANHYLNTDFNRCIPSSCYILLFSGGHQNTLKIIGILGQLSSYLVREGYHVSQILWDPKINALSGMKKGRKERYFLLALHQMNQKVKEM